MVRDGDETLKSGMEAGRIDLASGLIDGLETSAAHQDIDYAPTTVFPPATPIGNFIVSSLSGGITSTFSGINLTAGQSYSVLTTYNQTVAGTYPYSNTLTMNGPGVCSSTGMEAV